MSVINTNMTSMIGQTNLNKSQNALTTAMERLSSGMRINSAKDDTAGQAIANRMTAQVKGLAQAQRNANDGISIAQTAEGGLNQINDNLQRVRELTVQAQNGTNSASDIDSIQQEVNQRLEEIGRIATETDYNGTKILDTAGGAQNIAIQVGAKDGQQISITINANGDWNLGGNSEIAADSLATVNGVARTVAAKGFDVLSPGVSVAATVDASDQAGITGEGGTASLVTDASGALYIKDSGATTTTATIDASVTAGLTNGTGTVAFEKDDSGNLYVVDDKGGAGEAFHKIDASMIDSNGKVTLDISGAGAGVASISGGSAISSTSEFGTVTQTAVPAYYAVTSDMVGDDGKITAALGSLTAATAPASESAQAGSSVNVNVTGSDSTALAQLDTALKAVDTQRSSLGAIQNRFDSAITNLKTNETNLTSARSRIEDADYAVEVANMTRAQILQQAGTSVLSQANQLPQGVLSLLG